MTENTPTVPTDDTVSPLLRLPQAVQAENIDAGVAAHYGNPMIEQRSLLAQNAVVDLSHHGVLSVSGPDRLSWLNSIASQEVRGLVPGEATEMLLLDPAGRLEYAIRVLDDGVETWLLVEAAELTGLHAWLDRMRFTLRVQIVDHTLAYATVATLAADPADVGLQPAAPNGVPLVWHDPWVGIAPGGYQYAETVTHPGSHWTYTEVLLPREALAALGDDLAAGTLHTPEPHRAVVVPAGLLALEALRIAAWRPRRAREVDEKTLPHELDWLRTAVHLNKGCYRGQETVAKVHNLGHPPRRLVMLYLDGPDTGLPARGDDVMVVSNDDSVVGEESTVGRVTSVARHFELGSIALAVIKRATSPIAELLVRTANRDITARQVVIVPPDAGASATVPRLPRLGSMRR